jgi:hypothetical protein
VRAASALSHRGSIRRLAIPQQFAPSDLYALGQNLLHSRTNSRKGAGAAPKFFPQEGRENLSS